MSALRPELSPGQSAARVRPRTTRIFADLTVMRDALRLVIHLDRKAAGSHFIKVGRSGKRISHVVLLRTGAELRPILPALREAFDLSLTEEG